MKQYIDTLVETIVRNVAASQQAQLPLGLLIRNALDVGPLHVALECRDKLNRLVDDLTLSDEDRRYAAEQFRGLPEF